MFRAVSKFLTEVRGATSNKVYDVTKEAVLWDFRKEGTVEQWDCITDKDVHGFSQASLEPNGKGTGVIFHGTLSTAIPQEGKATHSGYCAIRSRPLKPSWFDAGTIDLSEYDEFELKVRGDGRRFIANLQYPGLARKDDVWQCFVFTRGGPEWEAIRLPFSEFFLTHRGYMQDKPFSFPQSEMGTFGILLADRVCGPFRLEIQHIKAVRNLLTSSESSIF